MIDDADIARIVDAVREALGNGAMPELLTREEVAALLRVDARTLRRLELEGEVPPAITIGGSKRWRRTTMERWLAARERDAERIEAHRRSALSLGAGRGSV